MIQRALSDVSPEEWVNIPEVGDARNKKQRNAHIRPDRYTPIPDSVLARGLADGGSHTSLDPRQQVSGCRFCCGTLQIMFAILLQLMGGFMTPYPGAASVTPGFATSTKIDLNQIGEARNSMLGIKLDQARVETNECLISLHVVYRYRTLFLDRQWWILKVI